MCRTLSARHLRACSAMGPHKVQRYPHKSTLWFFSESLDSGSRRGNETAHADCPEHAWSGTELINGRSVA